MKNNKFIASLICISIISSLFTPVFSADAKSTTPEPYNQDEFPQALKDFRRFEIITLGSMPFVMLDTTLVYTGYQYFTGESETFNVLNTNTFDTEQSTQIILTSLAISAGIGLTDLIIQIIKRQTKKKKARIKNSNANLNIYLDVNENEKLQDTFEFSQTITEELSKENAETTASVTTEENVEKPLTDAAEENIESQGLE